MKSKELILNAAAQCLMENPATGLNQIAKRAGVGRATLYRHFESKEELVLVLTEDAVKITDDALDQVRGQEATKEALQTLFDCLIPVGVKYHFLLSQQEIYSESAQETISKHEKEMLEFIHNGKRNGLFSMSHSDEWISLMINSMIYISWEAVANGVAAPKLVGKMAAETLLNGLS